MISYRFLSHKLAKYIPAQLYDDLFQDSNEVNIKSQRKKADYFLFSDIVSFY